MGRSKNGAMGREQVQSKKAGRSDLVAAEKRVRGENGNWPKWKESVSGSGKREVASC